MKQLLIAAVTSLVLAMPAYAAEKPAKPTNIEMVADQAVTAPTTPAAMDDCVSALEKCKGQETTDECKAVMERCKKSN